MYMLVGFAKLLAIAFTVQSGFRVSHVLSRGVSFGMQWALCYSATMLT